MVRNGPRALELFAYGTMACFFWRQMAWNLQRTQQSSVFFTFPTTNNPQLEEIQQWHCPPMTL
jgi:hypothetical protein